MIRFLINRPIAVIMSFILIILLGIVASNEIPVSLLPDSSIPKLEIIINNPGKSPENFDAEIVDKIRNNVLQVSNIIDINSYSNGSKSKVELEFNYNTNMDLVFFEVNEKIDEILPNLPYKIDRPKVIKSNLSDIPSLYLSVSLNKIANKSFYELSSFVEEKFKNQLEQSKEIAFVDVTGLAKNTIKIDVNENLITSLGITLEDVKIALNNYDFSFGDIEISEGNFIYKLSLENSINSIDDIKNITLKIKEKSILLSSIANIFNDLSLKDEYFFNGKKSISLAIIKDPNTRENHFSTKLDQLIKEINNQYPYIEIVKTKDQTLILKETLKSLSTSLILGVFFAVLITFFFLKSFKNVLLIFITTVVSLIIDILLFYVCDISINLISISGLILGIGLMIDNIIIVLDNIEQKISELKNIKEGSVSGVTEISSALISSALTTCSIFIPLIFLSGIAGILFYDQAISVTISLISSFFVSIILLPTIYTLLNKKIKTGRVNNNIISLYEKIYAKIYKYKSFTFILIFFVMIGGVLLFNKLEKNQLPEIETSELVFKIEWNKNYINEDLIKKSIKIIDLVKDDLLTSEFYINQQKFLSKTQRNEIENYETYYVLKLKNQTKKESIKTILSSKLKREYKNINLYFLAEENALNTMLMNEEYNLKIISYDKEVTSKDIQAKLKNKYPNIISSSIGKSKKIEFKIDDRKILSYGIDKNTLINFIKLKLCSEKLLNINYGNNYIPVSFYSSHEDLKSILSTKFTTDKGNQYSLKDIIDIEYKDYKKGVEANIGGVSSVLYVKTDLTEEIINYLKDSFSKSNISFGGNYQSIEKLKKEIFFVLILTLVLLYLILSIQFESLKLPIIILLEIPLDISISLLILYLTGQTLNVMSFIGLIIMSGIIINDSILKIDLINKLYREGNTIDFAIHTAGKRRLNAIIMTSLTTIFAITPTLFQNDISTQLQTPLIIALIGGLIIGTLVSIFIIPILFKKII
jgi:multidrug efflux pump subunit AcrB